MWVLFATHIMLLPLMLASVHGNQACSRMDLDCHGRVIYETSAVIPLPFSPLADTALLGSCHAWAF